MSRRTSGGDQARNTLGALPGELSAIFDVLLDDLAERVVKRLGGGFDGWVDQGTSPLGSRRHRSIVGRRMATGRPGAAIVGRRYLLSKEALTEELEAMGKPPVEETSDIEEQVRRNLGLDGAK